MNEPALQTEPGTARIWMVERTFSADSPHILVIVYATPDGRRHLRKERAFNRFGNTPGPTVTAAIDVDEAQLVTVDDTALQERYAAEAKRMRDRHDPDEAV